MYIFGFWFRHDVIGLEVLAKATCVEGMVFTFLLRGVSFLFFFRCELIQIVILVTVSDLQYITFYATNGSFKI